MIWHGVRHGHPPREVAWNWPIWMLLGFVHAEMRRNGLRTYRLTARPRIDPDAPAPPLHLDLEDWPPPDWGPPEAE